MRLSDLQFGDKEVTLNHLAVIGGRYLGELSLLPSVFMLPPPWKKLARYGGQGQQSASAAKWPNDNHEDENCVVCCACFDISFASTTNQKEPDSISSTPLQPEVLHVRF